MRWPRSSMACSASWRAWFTDLPGRRQPAGRTRGGRTDPRPRPGPAAGADSSSGSPGRRGLLPMPPSAPSLGPRARRTGKCHRPRRTRFDRAAQLRGYDQSPDVTAGRGRSGPLERPILRRHEHARAVNLAEARLRRWVDELDEIGGPPTRRRRYRSHVRAAGSGVELGRAPRLMDCAEPKITRLRIRRLP